MIYPSKSKFIIIAIITSIIIIWFFVGQNNGRKYLQVQTEITQLNKEMQDLQDENKRLKDDIDKLKNDNSYLADVARRKYGFLKKNEMVFDFEPVKK